MLRRRELKVSWKLGEALPPSYDGGAVVSSVHVAQYAAPLRRELGEVLWVLMLDAGHRVLGHRELSSGGMRATVCDPGEVARVALLAGASAVVLVHNHPSGVVSPSPEDVTATTRVAWVCRAVGITLLDHVIVAGGGAVGGHSSAKADGWLVTLSDTAARFGVAEVVA